MHARSYFVCYQCASTQTLGANIKQFRKRQNWKKTKNKAQGWAGYFLDQSEPLYIALHCFSSTDSWISSAYTASYCPPLHCSQFKRRQNWKGKGNTSMTCSRAGSCFGGTCSQTNKCPKNTVSLHTDYQTKLVQSKTLDCSPDMSWLRFQDEQNCVWHGCISLEFLKHQFQHFIFNTSYIAIPVTSLWMSERTFHNASVIYFLWHIYIGYSCFFEMK